LRGWNCRRVAGRAATPSWRSRSSAPRAELRRVRARKVWRALNREGHAVPTGVAVTPDGKTAFVANGLDGTVSTIDVKTGTKNPTDITVGEQPIGVAITPGGKTAFVTNSGGGSVSTIDVKTRGKNPTDITVGSAPFGVAITPDGKTAFGTNNGSGTVSTINVKARTRNLTDIPVGTNPKGVAITPNGNTALVTNSNFGAMPSPKGNSVSTIDVKTRTKNPADITVGTDPLRVAVTPDGKTAFVTNGYSSTVSTIDVKTRTKEPHRHCRWFDPDLGGGHAGRQDRLRHQLRHRDGVDD
jgi:YVTN family beta-propeller protein